MSGDRRRAAAAASGAISSAVGLALGLLIGSAAAQDAGFCPSLRAAYAAAQRGPQALGAQRVAWGSCSLTRDGTLRCQRLLVDDGEGLRAAAVLMDAVAACVAPLGLRATRKRIHDVAITTFDGDEAAPSVGIFHSGPVVTVSIITPD